ncbi:replication-relaxation family protein [Streptomyces avermitilis]|uniref:replication-relaxation family protein n=1 Tax=Streptomyces avermitilis TaxID=33903 RepID=UPI00369A97A8
MIGADAGSGDRLALAVLTQYRMATTEQMHRMIAPSVRIEQTRRRLANLRAEGLVDRITLPQAGRRTRVWFPTAYGVQLVSEWPEMRGHRPSRTMSDPTAVRLKASHTLTVTETALVFLEDARRHGDLFRPLDWIPEVHHLIGSGEAVIPEPLLYYPARPRRRRARVDAAGIRRSRPGNHGTRTPRRQADRVRAPLSLRVRSLGMSADPPGTGAGGVAAALSALPSRPVRPGRHRTRRCREPCQGRAGAGQVAPSGFLHDVPVLAAALAVLQHGPCAPVWRPVHDPDPDPDQRVNWTGLGHRQP